MTSRHLPPWWAIALWELGLLVAVFVMFAIWSSAKETVALLAAGTKVLGEVVDSTVHDDGEDVTYELTLWVPLTGNGFEVRHRCGNHVCATASKQSGARLTVLVDPVVRTWAVVH